jgi:hypothetical protein
VNERGLRFSDEELQALIKALEERRSLLQLEADATEEASGKQLHFLNNLLGKLCNTKNIRVLKGEWTIK